MEAKRLSLRYSVQTLSLCNAQEILDLYNGNPMYFEHMHSMPTLNSVKDDLTALPPGKTYSDKHYVGFYDGKTLVAVMDLIEGFPNPETAFIGLFMVNQAYQGKGVGSLIIQETLSALRTMGFSYVRLGYVETNAQSRAFWYKNGFLPTGVKSEQDKYTVVMMQRSMGNEV